MKKLAIILLLASASVTCAKLVDLTPGGFTPSLDGSGDPPAYSKVFNNWEFGAAISPIFNLGPYYNDNGFGGTYLFSNLFETSPTNSANVSWNLTGQSDGDWLTYIRVFGAEDGIGFENIYQVEGGRSVSGPFTVTLNGNTEIAAIQFWGRNPGFPTPDAGSTFLLFSLVLIVLFVERSTLFTRRSDGVR